MPFDFKLKGEEEMEEMEGEWKEGGGMKEERWKERGGMKEERWKEGGGMKE